MTTTVLPSTPQKEVFKTPSLFTFMVDCDENGWGKSDVLLSSDCDLPWFNNGGSYGNNIFEGMKAHYDRDGNLLVVRPEDHLRRFQRSSQRMCMPALPEEFFREGIQTILKEHAPKLDNPVTQRFYFQPRLFNTSVGPGAFARKSYSFRLTVNASVTSCDPIKVYIDPTTVRAPEGGFGDVKVAGNYAAASSSEFRAKELGLDTALFLGEKKRGKKLVQELSTMNLILVTKKGLITPSTRYGTILPGITRDSVIRLAKERGLLVFEKNIDLDFVLEGLRSGEDYEAFATGTAGTIAPIVVFYYDGEFYELRNEDDSVANVLYTDIMQVHRGEIHPEWTWKVT